MAIIGKKQVVDEDAITGAFVKVGESITTATGQLNTMCESATKLITALGGVKTFKQIVNITEDARKAEVEFGILQAKIVELTKEIETLAAKSVAASKKKTEATKAEAGSVAALKKELKESQAAYEKMANTVKATTGAELEALQKKILALNEYNKTLKQSITDATNLARAQKKASDDAVRNSKSLETQKSRELSKQVSGDYNTKTKNELDQEKIRIQKFLDDDAKRVASDKLLSKEQTITHNKRLAEIDTEIAAQNKFEQQARMAGTKRAFEDKALADKAAIPSRRLITTALNAEKGSVEQLTAVNSLLLLKQKQLTLSTSEERAKYNQLSAAIDANKAKISSLNPHIVNQSTAWGRLARSIMTYASAYLGVQAAIQAGQAIYRQTKELDALNFSMRIIIKSSNEFAQTQKYLSDLAVNFGGNLITVTEGYVRFRAATVQSNMSALETQKIFTAVSKVSATLGLGEDKVRNIYLAMEQMISKGTVMTEELRRQLGNELPGAFGIMANALGVTSNELNKMLKAQQVISKDALPKFAVALEKAFGVENVTKVDTLAAAQGRLGTQVTGLIKAMSLSGSFKGFINGMASFVGLIKDNIGFFGGLTKSAILLAESITIVKIAGAAEIVIQKLSIYFRGVQITQLRQLEGAELSAAMASRLAAKETLTFSTVVKTFGGWVSILINLLVTSISFWYMFIKGSNEAKNSIKGFAEGVASERAELETWFDSLRKSKEGSFEFKNALESINNLLIKGGFNDNLLTTNNYLKDQTTAYKLLSDAIYHNALMKAKSNMIEEAAKVLYEAEQKSLNSFSNQPVDSSAGYGMINGKMAIKYGGFNLSAQQQGILSAKQRDVAEKNLNDKGQLAELNKPEGVFGTIKSYIKEQGIKDSQTIKNIMDFYESDIVKSLQQYTKDIATFHDKTTQALEMFPDDTTKNPNKLGTNQLDEIKKVYEQYKILQDNKNTDPKVLEKFKEDNKLILEDGKTIEENLQHQLGVYKLQVDQIAIINAMQEAEKKDKKGSGKGNEYTSLEQAKVANEKELEQYKRTKKLETDVQADALDQQFADRVENASSQAQYDTAMGLLESKNKIDEINQKIELEQELIDFVKLSAEERGTIEKNLANYQTELVNEKVDANILAEKRKIIQQKADAKQQLDFDKEIEDNVKAQNDRYISGQTSTADNKKLDIQTKALADLKANPKDEVKIHDQMNLDMIKTDMDMYDAIAAYATSSTEEDIKLKDWALQRKLELKVQYGNAEFDVDKKNEEKTRAVKIETAQKIGELINQGFEFSKQIYAGQEAAAKTAYDNELAAAGDNVEGKIIAERKYNEEIKKIKKQQAIADKAQALFNIAMSTAMAVMQVTAQTGVGAAILVPLIIALGLAQAATVLAQPIPEFFTGTENAPATFIAGDKPGSKGASELIELTSGESFLTPDRPTLFSDPKFKGAKIFPSFHDKTAQMLNNYALHGGSQVFVDMSTSNRHLASMDEQMKKPKEERYTDARGKQFLKRGSITTELI